MKIIYESDEDEDLLLAELNHALQEASSEETEEDLPEDVFVEDEGQDDEYLLEEEIRQALEMDYNDRIEHLSVRTNPDGSVSYQSGQRKKISEERFLTEREKQEYTEQYYNLVHHMAHKYHNNHALLEEYDEFYGEATFGFTKALNTYDIGSDIPFKNYACFCMDNVLRTYCQKLKKVTNPDIAISFDDDVDGDVEMGKIGDIFIDENQALPDEIVERQLDQEVLKTLFEKLSDYLNPTQTFVISSFYGVNGCEELNKNQICKTLHIPMKEVNDTLESSLAILKQKLPFVL